MPFGPPSQTVSDRLQIAHPNPANPTTVELLAREPAPFVDCAGASLAQARQRRQGEGILANALGMIRDLGTRAAAVFRPTPLYAVHGGLGGKTTSFSPFGAVDPGPAACPTSAPTGFAIVACFGFTSIPGTWHGFVVGNSLVPIPTVGQLSADYVLVSPTGFTRIPPNTPPDVNQAQYTFESEFNGTNWFDVLRGVTPANQPPLQMTVFVIKPMIVGVCSTPMSGVAQTVATVDVAMMKVAPGGVIKICPQTIVVPGSFVMPAKSMTIEAEIPANKPQFIVNGPGIFNAFILFGAPGPVVFRNLSFTLTGGAIGAIDIGSQSGPTPWTGVLVENSVFNLQPGIGRALRVFSTTLPNPTVTFRGNQVTGGVFPVVTLTGSPTSTIEVLSNSFTGEVGNAGAQIQSEANVRVEGNTFSGGGCGIHGCIYLLNVANATVRNNTMTVINPNPLAPIPTAIKFSNSNGTITQNSITGAADASPVDPPVNIHLQLGGIAITPATATDFGGANASTVLVTQNTVTRATTGLRVVGGGASVTGSNNVFTNVYGALRVDNTSATASSLTMTGNDFTPVFRPLAFPGATTAPNIVNATCNWWGSASGPQNILAGTPLASYSPWATAPIANGAGGLCNGTANFTISASPTSLIVAPGGSGNSTVAIVRTNLTSDIALSLVGLPAGMTGGLTPATLTGATLTSTLTINVAPTVAVGTYQITVQGVGGSLTRTAVVNVTVSAGG